MHTKFYKVTDSATLTAIREQLKLRSAAFKTFQNLLQRYKAELYQYSDSIRFGLNFQGLRFKKPTDFDHSLFKFTISSHIDGFDYLCMPRKANKKFYTEFMNGLTEFRYEALINLLFGQKYIDIGFYSKNHDAFYFSVKGINPSCICTEITATEYELAGQNKEAEVASQ